ncbi:cholecystokinin receptor type A-like [Lingula anatina]|uniref:Cholecystokinin receptor type A-like n=1 Tax=Lingula anatina TaxID=7574 RepID=A0A1S3K679_LINAN|nr:cholecystokinin receptor type A-like [Lingula anatina]|eukprot:XP_013418130.1 cholecystokinin receptor type A-like [Lingula anatina]
MNALRQKLYNASCGSYFTKDINFTNGFNFTGDSSSADAMNVTCHWQVDYEIVKVVLPVIIGVFCFVGITGNSMVIYVVYKNRRMNILFLNLAIADLLFNVLCLPINALFIATDREIRISPFLCKTTYYSFYVSMGVSIYSLVSICLLRFAGLKYPFVLRKILHRSTAIKASCVTWAVMLVLNAPLLFIMHETEERVCGIQGDASLYYIYVTVIFGIDFTLPVIIIAVLSILIIIQARQVRDEQENLAHVPCQHVESTHNSPRRALKRLMVLVTILFAVFLICWAPSMILFMYNVIIHATDDGHQHFACSQEIRAVAQLFFTVLTFANSCLNPILYNFVSKEFRGAFSREFLPMCPCMDSPRDASFTISAKRRVISTSPL